MSDLLQRVTEIARTAKKASRALALAPTAVRDAALRADLGHRGRARVLDRFTQVHIANATYEVYRQMLAPAVGALALAPV